MKKSLVSVFLGSLLLTGIATTAFATDNALPKVAVATGGTAAIDKSRCIISENNLTADYYNRHPGKGLTHSQVWSLAVVAASNSCQVGGTMILRDPSKASYGYPNVTAKSFLELYCDILDIKKLDTGDYACKITQSVDWQDAVKRHNVQYNQEHGH